MADKTLLDQFVEYAVMAQAGAASATGDQYAKLDTGITNRQTVAWELKKIEFMLPGAWLNSTILASFGNYIMFSLYNAIPKAAYLGPISLIDAGWIDGIAYEKGVSAIQQPAVHVFDEPILLSPMNLYSRLEWSVTGGLVAGVSAYFRFFYRERELSQQDWYDLWQLRTGLGT